ncbi:type III CRISPR-associated RAMP protein Csx7 [Thermofilum pendens]|uniref:CRISPR-associated RAMP protein, SSO1426 family n=1 Tax=Thermofilum pendens (strain DSM 2475 / Hrk 5) TaxID=368408 RepID=A1RZQ6_THEPD|nr:CRISPR-associated RAMP protein Csx7 [Thermofilum pendens]ABL78686.1 CRISPR-associated RAMP protein, SSO1426 family [Thermofilum pendens Hrk 5]
MSQVPWSSHRVLLREAVFRGYLVAESPLRVGAGREAPLGSPVDLSVLRVRLGGKSVPYIPGSSLKGVFRSFSQSLAVAKGLSVCSGLSGETCMDYEDPSLGGEKLLSYLQGLMREGHSLEAVRLFHEKACLMCKVFGAPSFSGHVEFSDAYPVDEKGGVVDVSTGVRTGIAINRRTGAVYERALYQVEYVEPGARFRFEARTTNLPNYALGLLSAVIRMMNEGWVRVGGFKTRGFGEVRVEGLEFAARGATVRGSVLVKLDDYDSDVDLSGLAEARDGWLRASGDSAWKALAKLEEVWSNASFGKRG